LKDFSVKYEKPGSKFSASAINALTSYHWPGNIRELKHTIEKAMILCDSDVIKPGDLALNNINFKNPETEVSLSIEDAEKKVIITSLNKNKWNISETARELNIGRQTLYRKIQKYDLQ
jgi:two-component system, NtrC family, response regulator HydG